MSTFTPPSPAFERASLAVPSAAFEVLGYLSVVGIGTVCFLLGWLTPEGAAVLTVLLISALIVLAWKRFDEGRHPCFLFLCMLLFFQGGRLIAYCLGYIPDPLTVELLTPSPFSLNRDEAGLVLLLLVLSAICIYAPCRWNYRPILPPRDVQTRKYLPYLYLLFYGTLPIQVFKNYRYYQYAQEHGGYAYFWVNHAGFAASVPLFVRVISLISFPAFVAIFVLEYRRKFLYTATILYFATASLILLMGSRGGFFGLIVALWCASRIKSTRKTRLLTLASLVVILMLVADFIQSFRQDSDSISSYVFAPVEFVKLQGASLNVTEVTVKYREFFAPYGASYLYHELPDAFVPSDTQGYFRGRRLSFDVSVLLSPQAFYLGSGTAGSYVGEAYVIGGIAAVVVISLLIGGVLHLMHYLSRNPLSFFLVVMVLPDFLQMPRGQLLDWVSALLRNGISMVLLALGWGLYSFLTSIRKTPANNGLFLPETPNREA